MNRVIALIGIAVVVELAVVGVASADVVEPAPACCPPGSKPESCHGGPHCDPLVCVTNADCVDNGVCKEMAYCTSKISCDSWRPPGVPKKYFDAVDSQCSGTCADGELCKTLKVCVTEKGCATEEERGSSCACTLPAEAFGGGLSAAAIASLFAGTALGRRWRRSRR